ncbi:calponin [Didymella glomerata]|uniref:Calponin n=1 Tax=Didymella glomerata TaxID=749621 RepID=A0A9W8WTK9_9PLEO|nr:calponin [Didymella glomerata]
MASVTSLDQDMKNLRMGRYTPQAANEVRAWIEDTLGERLPAGDLLDALKDGTVLCRLVNMAIPTPVRFKKSAMPFIQMENIAHFLKACELPPLNMPSHDRFLTVDLYESKDPAQVLQCLTAFSRTANAINASSFPTSIGPKRGGSVMSPTTPSRPDFSRSYGSSTFNPMKPPPDRPQPLSPSRTGGSSASRNSNGVPKSPPGGVSSWSKKADQGVTSPAWNIHQYGYMGGASQGNQGIAFGARRQITTAGPHVPNMAEKERKRREKAEEEERLRVAAEEAERHRRVEREAEEERQRAEEERLWEEESRKQREAKERRLEEQKRGWEEQERQWKMQEEARQREEQATQEAAEKEARRKRAGSDARLRGQYLSQYQAEQKPHQSDDQHDRIAELERQLEEAKERERQYQAERETRKQRTRSKSRTRERSKSRPAPPPRAPSPQESNVSWAQADDRAYLRDAWDANQAQPARPVHTPEPAFSSSTTSRPLPEPASPRPLPDPAAYMRSSHGAGAGTGQSRTDRFLSSHPAPVAPKPTTYAPPESTSTNEQRAEDARRKANQQTTKDRGWASKSLLEREMERERERQKEWEQSQRELASVSKDPTAGAGEGQSWDVNQYGYMGGDSQNRGGISFGGKRQILGPRPFGPR